MTNSLETGSRDSFEYLIIRYGLKRVLKLFMKIRETYCPINIPDCKQIFEEFRKLGPLK